MDTQPLNQPKSKKAKEPDGWEPTSRCFEGPFKGGFNLAMNHTSILWLWLEWKPPSQRLENTAPTVVGHPHCPQGIPFSGVLKGLSGGSVAGGETCRRQPPPKNLPPKWTTGWFDRNSYESSKPGTKTARQEPCRESTRLLLPCWDYPFDLPGFGLPIFLRMPVASLRDGNRSGLKGRASPPHFPGSGPKFWGSEFPEKDNQKSTPVQLWISLRLFMAKGALPNSYPLTSRIDMPFNVLSSTICNVEMRLII